MRGGMLSTRAEELTTYLCMVEDNSGLSTLLKYCMNVRAKNVSRRWSMSYVYFANLSGYRVILISQTCESDVQSRGGCWVCVRF